MMVNKKLWWEIQSHMVNLGVKTDGFLVILGTSFAQSGAVMLKYPTKPI